MGTQSPSAASSGQTGQIPITASAAFDLGAQSGNSFDRIINLNGTQPVGAFGDPIDALFGGVAGFFGNGTAEPAGTISQPIAGFRVGPLLTVAVLGVIGVVIVRALRKG